MKISHSHYNEARRSLEYIDHIKLDIEQLLFSKTKLLYSGIHVTKAEYSHALLCINEAIDELFYSHRKAAKRVVECWEQQ